MKEQETVAPKYHITTFGCQMNVHDSENIAGMLEKIGYEAATALEAADLILLNTCCVRENAENRTFGHLGNLKTLKERKPGLIIGICGCMAQQPAVTEKIRESFPYVDLVFGTHNLHRLPEMLAQLHDTSSRIIEVLDCEGEIHEGLPVKRDESFRAWVTIMYGCNNYCSYCIVPYVRGRERSRNPEAILSEIRELRENGVKEVTLLGQNVNSYGKELASDWNFARLLREVAHSGVERIRFQTSHPKDLSAELIATIAAEKNISRHLHLPFQAGGSRILKLMNRHYTKESYQALAARIQAEITGIALTTDIIVGFPGETEADFQDTLDLVATVRFDGAFTFIYSPRAGTPAATMPDQVDEEVKKERLLRLIKLQNQISLERNQALIGTLQEILVEGSSEKNAAIWSGRTSQNKLVHFKPTFRLTVGDMAAVRIIGAKTFTLEGELLG